MTTISAPAASYATPVGLVTHLVELRARLMKCAAAIGVGTIAGWVLYPRVISILVKPYNQIAGRSLTAGQALIATGPAEGFAVRIHVALFVAVALAMPVVLWQLWRFVSPGLYRHEKRYALPFVSSAVALFLAGAGIAYWTLPKALDWLAGVGGTQITQAYTADKYFQLIAYMMLAFGICFEFPVLLVFLQLAGVVHNPQLRRYWRQTIVAITVVVAVATPSNDPISMLALSIPLVVFFFAAMLIGWLFERRRTSTTSTRSA